MSYNPSENEFQEDCGRLVERNVHLCVSCIVERLFEHEPDLRYECCDNLYLPVCPECGNQLSPTKEPVDPGDEEGDEVYICSYCERHIADLSECDSEPQEVYEWWAVSSWLADRLREQDEVLCDDLYGLTVWGRCTTGQAIAIDGVIRTITRELHEKYSQGESDHG